MNITIVSFQLDASRNGRMNLWVKKELVIKILMFSPYVQSCYDDRALSDGSSNGSDS